MSQITNVVTTEFRGRAGQAIATMGQLGRSFSNLDRNISNTTRMSERLNNQWKAIGTTIRYAIAGQAVFGMTRMVGQLREMQQQMGLITAIGTVSRGGMTGQAITGQNLTTMMGDIRQGAVESLTPVQEYTSAVINLLSTVENVPQDQITPIATTIAQSAKLAQINVEDATKAFTTMNVAFGKPTNLANIQRTAQEFFLLTKLAPGGPAAGGQIIQQMGQLAQVTRAAGGTQEDMMSLLLTGLRSGIPPAQLGRGLQFMIQTLGFPGQQVKASRQALASVGIVPAADLTLQQRMTRVFGRARNLGLRGSGNINQLDEETLAQFEGTDETAGALAQLGIKGAGAEFLGTIFRRIHALRTALAISGQIDVGTAQKDMQLMRDAANGHITDINNLSKQWENFRQQAKLQEATVALNAMSLQVANAFAPIMNFAASGITKVTGAAAAHPEATDWIARGGAAFLGAAGLAKMTGVRLPGRFGKLLGRASLGQGFVMANAAQAAISGNVALGGSPQNPMYVTVVGQIFGGRTPGPTGTGIDIPGGGAGGGAGAGGRRRIPPWALWGGRVGGPLAVASAVMAASGAAAEGQGRFSGRAGSSLRRAQELFGQQGMGAPVTGIDDPQKRMIKGEAHIFLTLERTDAAGRVVRQRVHVPVELFQNGTKPTQKGSVKGRSR